MNDQEFKESLNQLSPETLPTLLKECDTYERVTKLCTRKINYCRFPIPDSILELLNTIKSRFDEAYLQNNTVTSYEKLIYLLFAETKDQPTQEAIVKWCISQNTKLNEPMVAFIKEDDFLPIEKIKAMEQKEFDDLLGLLNEEHKDYFQAIRALGTPTNCRISFNGFIEILKLLKKQQKTNEEIINWMTHITLTDKTPVGLSRLNDIVEILQEPTLMNALFETLLKNDSIKNALKDISSIALEPASPYMITCEELMAHVEIISDKQFTDLLRNWTDKSQGMDEIFNHALGLNDKITPAASIGRTHVLAYHLSCSLFTSQSQDSSLLIEAQQHQIEWLLSYLKTYPEKEKEKKDLIEIFKLALEYHNCDDKQERTGKLNTISSKTASFVKKYQTTLTLAADIANIVICLTVLPMLIFCLCSLIMNSKVFYGRENLLTEEVQQLGKDITALGNIDRQVPDQQQFKAIEMGADLLERQKNKITHL